MSATSRPDGLFDTIVGPSTVTETSEQLAAWSDQLVDGDHHHPDDLVEQLAEYHARPTKPGQADPHANDPSRTTSIQRQYAQKLRGRFDDIRAEIRRGIDDRDVLRLDEEDGEGLSLSDILAPAEAPDAVREEYYELLAEERYDDARGLVEQLADFDPDELVGRDFDFDRNARKHEAFMEWLRGQEEQGVLEVIERGDNTYVRKAYERGVRNSHAWIDGDLDAPDISFALDRPVHQDKLSLLYERNYEALRGITDDVAREISRELAEGMAEGAHAEDVARRLADRVDKIGRTRATTLARTEIMYAHNEATVSEYERILGSDIELEIQAEVSTAGDHAVCDICSPWDERKLTLEDARQDGPPFHPRCRCIVLPASERTESTDDLPEYVDPPQGEMPDATIEQGVRNSNIVGMDEENIVETFQTADHGVAITEDTWEYGGLWDADERVIMIHRNLWERLDDDARKYLLKHELYERRRAVSEFGDAIGKTVSQSDAVSAHHTSVNADLVDELGEGPLKSYARATREKLIDEGTDSTKAIEQAMYRISGSGIDESEVFD